MSLCCVVLLEITRETDDTNSTTQYGHLTDIESTTTTSEPAWCTFFWLVFTCTQRHIIFDIYIMPSPFILLFFFHGNHRRAASLNMDWVTTGVTTCVYENITRSVPESLSWHLHQLIPDENNNALSNCNKYWPKFVSMELQIVILNPVHFILGFMQQNKKPLIHNRSKTHERPLHFPVLTCLPPHQTIFLIWAMRPSWLSLF